MLYVHTQTKNASNVPFDTDFIKFKIVDKKVPKRTAIQKTVLDAVRSYNEVIEIAGKSTVRTVYALPKFTIPDDKTAAGGTLREERRAASGYPGGECRHRERGSD